MSLLGKLTVTRTLRDASRLADSGKVQEAVRRLAAANRKYESVAIERALVDMLLQSESTEAVTNPRTGREDDCQAVLNLQPGVVPEVSAARFSVSALREAINHSGYLIVRGMFAADTVEPLRACIDEALRARVAVEAGELPAAGNPWYYASPHFPGDHRAYAKQQRKYDVTGSMKVIDCPRGAFRVLEMYRQHGLAQMLSDYFGERAALATLKWVFRLVTPREVGTGIGGGWHQDGQFMGDGVRALNMWVALSACGEGTTAPGLTLLPRRIDRILEFGTKGARLDWVVGGTLVEQLAQDTPVVNPYFAAGDALFFDHYSLHRSGHVRGQTTNRYALESWFYARSGRAGNAVIDLF